MDHLRALIKKYTTPIVILLCLMFMIIVSLAVPAENWYSMQKKIDQVMDDPAYTYGDFYSRKTLKGPVYSVHYRFSINGSDINARQVFQGRGPFSDTGFRNKLNGTYLVVYDKTNPEMSVMVPSCPVTDSADAQQYAGREIEWRFFSGAYLK